MTAGEYVLLGRTPYIGYLGAPGRDDRAQAAAASDRLDVARFADRRLGTLSGGERQRVVLARALAQSPDVLLLDEPTSLLDIGYQQQVLELVDDLRRSRGVTVVATLHDLTQAGQYAGHLVLLADGRVAAAGPPAAVLTEELIARVYAARVTVTACPGGHPVVTPVRPRAAGRTKLCLEPRPRRTRLGNKRKHGRDTRKTCPEYGAVMADIFDGYRLAEAWDEMFSAPGKPRPPYAALITVLQPMDPAELRFRADQLARVFTDRGVTYDFAGEERPFPLDLIPRVIDAVEWDLVARGVRQRVLALEAFLADIYGPGHAFEDGVVPWRLVFTSPRFRREVADFTPPNGVRVHVAGIDLVRDENGKFRVLEDNVRVPSGVSYVIENRLAMTRTFPALFAEQSVHEVEEYPSRLLAALRAAAPAARRDDPVVVVLTPGVHNAAYFEHTLLARLMGVELVEGRDLFCSHNRVYVHTTRGRAPRRRHLPPGGRRLPRPAALPSRLGDRLPGPHQRRAGRPRHHRQRGGQRGGRRQARLHLHSRPHPVLPGRGTAAG